MSKQITRRDLIHAGCTIAGATLVPHFMDQAEAGFLHRGSAAASSSSLSLRNVINLNDFSFITNEYPTIDHIPSGTNCVGPRGSNYTTGATWPSIIDANGWPNSAANTGDFGGGFTIPDPANYGGPYIVDLPLGGNGVIAFSLAGGATATWTATSPVNCSVTFNGSGTIQFTSTGGASAASIQLSLTSTTSGPQLVNFIVQSTGASGSFVKKVRWYRTGQDATDLAAGLYWRRAWKQPLVNLDPSAIRCMNNIGGNSDRNCRWENRSNPLTTAGWTSGSQWNISPSYSTDATGNNQMAVAAATPTASNTQATPTSMVHGELATFRIPSSGGGLRCGNNISVAGITNATNGVVTTNSAHGYSTGDIIGHSFSPVNNLSATINGTTAVTISSGANVANGMFAYGPGVPANTTVVSGGGTTSLVLSNAATFSGNINIAFRSMQNLHLFPCTITVTGATTYQLNINTTSMGTFSTNAASVVFTYQFQTLQVGSGSDRTAYPCLFGSGAIPYSQFGNFMAASTYKTGYFDKNISGQTDGSGNYIKGAWKFDSIAQNVAASGDMPIEIAVALINELNAMSPAHTIGLWINMPVYALTSMDPDYTSASDWGVNCMDVILNPSSAVRASGYSALGYSGPTQLNQPTVIVEYSNEDWNNDDQHGWLEATGVLRWPTSYPYQDFQDMQALRSTLIARSIKAANPPGLSRVKFVLGMFGTQGMLTGGSNYHIAFGGNVTANPIFIGDWYTNDTLVTAGSWGRPIDNHDGVCPATYFDPPDVYYGVLIGKGSFVDDSAMYNGTDNSSASISWTATISGTTMTVTGTPSSSVRAGQQFTGAGVSSGTQIIADAFSGGGSFTGQGGAGTYGLSKSSTVGSPTTMSNIGGNYTGAANQSQAITNFVAQVVDAGNIYSGETTTRYGTVVIPQFASQMPAGKVVVSYEGGTDWQTQAGNSQGGHVLTAGDSTFSIAVINSPQWATAQVNFFNVVGAISGSFMPSIYIWVGAAGTERWSYCTPDTYATISGTPTEGAALTVNSPVWIAMGNRNQALPS